MSGDGESVSTVSASPRNDICVIDSKLDRESKSYLWKLQNFDRVCSNPLENQRDGNGDPSLDRRCLLDHDFVQSPIIDVGENSPMQTKWTIFIEKASPNSEYLQVYLYLQSTGLPDGNPLILYKFSIVGPRGNVLHQKVSMQMIIMETQSGWGEAEFIRIDTLYENKEKFLSGNILRLRVDLEVIRDVTHQVVPLTQSPKPEMKTVEVVELARSWLKELWRTNDFSDLNIICGETTFKAHKCILSKASPVFEAMLTTEMNEKATNTVLINDIQESVLGKMLEFVYTGDLENGDDWINMELMSGLLYAADKYALEGFKKTCYDKLCDLALTEETAPAIVVFIHLYGAPPEVENEVYNFVLAKLPNLQTMESYQMARSECPMAFLPLLERRVSLEF